VLAGVVEGIAHPTNKINSSLSFFFDQQCNVKVYIGNRGRKRVDLMSEIWNKEIKICE
jgi:hypothetical protein